MNLLHGYELQGKAIVVEPIKDHEKYGRIRAPQKIVDYAVGPIKRQRRGELNTMRRASATGSATLDGEDGERYKHERERRRTRLARRKDRGRYKNQQRKNSRATAPWC